jgi:catechol 2,3-dioxygenase-like lactoylglutathione lyase family enzyme
MTTWADGISAITMFTEDLAESKRFYQDVFELEHVYEDGNSCVFRIGGTLINVLRVESADELIAPAAVAAPTAGHRLVFTVGVEDVDAMCDRLAARGVKLINGPMDRPWGIRTASFADPGGHIWEIAK